MIRKDAYPSKIHRLRVIYLYEAAFVSQAVSLTTGCVFVADATY
jgi:hypothetical protein